MGKLLSKNYENHRYILTQRNSDDNLIMNNELSTAYKTDFIKQLIKVSKNQVNIINRQNIVLEHIKQLENSIKKLTVKCQNLEKIIQTNQKNQTNLEDECKNKDIKNTSINNLIDLGSDSDSDTVESKKERVMFYSINKNI